MSGAAEPLRGSQEVEPLLPDAVTVSCAGGSGLNAQAGRIAIDTLS
jgi:hypothetical protein